MATQHIKVLLTVVPGLAIAAIVIWMWGVLPASVVLFTMLALTLCWTGRWKQAFVTRDGTILSGGLLMWFAAFVTHAYGPMGGVVTQADLLRNIDSSWVGIGWLMSLSGTFLGATIATLAAVAVAVDSNKVFSQLRYIVVAMWLVMVVAGNMTVLWILSDGVLAGRQVAAVVISAATIIALSIVVRCEWPSTGKAAAVHIVGALSLLLGMVPIGDNRAVLAELARYGMGYWMFCAGCALVIVGSACAVIKRPGS